jgi:hypothetical protein
MGLRMVSALGRNHEASASWCWTPASRHNRNMTTLMPAELDTTYCFTGQSLVGQRFHRLTVRAFAGAKVYPSKHQSRHVVAHWLCACDCGKEIVVSVANLRSSHVQSCGCFQKEHRIRHGYGGRVNRHPLYHVWDAMVQRCTNPNSIGYSSYGGRGISVCDAWFDFANFLADMGALWQRGLTIERRDNDGNYCPSNCIFIPRAEQPLNKQNTVRVTVGERTQTLSQWVKETGCNYATARSRLKRGWPAERLFI